MKASELNGTHLGETIGVEVGGAWCRDILSGVNHEADIITSQQFLDENPTYDLGRRGTYLNFVRFGSVRVAGGTEVEIIPGVEREVVDSSQSAGKN